MKNLLPMPDLFKSFMAWWFYDEVIFDRKNFFYQSLCKYDLKFFFDVFSCDWCSIICPKENKNHNDQTNKKTCDYFTLTFLYHSCVECRELMYSHKRTNITLRERNIGCIRVNASPLHRMHSAICPILFNSRMVSRWFGVRFQFIIRTKLKQLSTKNREQQPGKTFRYRI